MFRAFTGRSATRVGRFTPSRPRQVAVIGTVRKIEYDTVRDGEPVTGTHTFHAGSRPLLAAGTRPGELYLIGRRFKFTSRGIVDLGPDGRPIE